MCSNVVKISLGDDMTTSSFSNQQSRLARLEGLEKFPIWTRLTGCCVVCGKCRVACYTRANWEFETLGAERHAALHPSDMSQIGKVFSCTSLAGSPPLKSLPFTQEGTFFHRRLSASTGTGAVHIGP